MLVVKIDVSGASHIGIGYMPDEVSDENNLKWKTGA